MSILVNCLSCKKRIMGKAALIQLIGIPDEFDHCTAKKIHVCKACKDGLFIDVERFIMNYQPPKGADK